MTTPPSPSGQRGRWIVLLLVSAGLIGAVTSVVYWGQAAREENPSESQPSFDPKRAQRELDDLQKRFNDASYRHDIDSVTPDVKRLVEKYPRFASAHTLLAQLLMEKGESQAALDELDLSLKYDGQQPEVEKLAGTLALAMGQSDNAIHHFDMAVGLEPPNAEYRIFLAEGYVQKKDFDKARFTLLEALKINSHLDKAYYALSDLDAKQGDVAQAIVQAQRAVAEAPANNPDLKAVYVQWLATLLRRNNRPEDALQALEGLDEKQRRSLPVLNDMAVCWTMTGQPIKGAQLFEKAMAQAPDEWRLPAGAALWYLRAGDKADAQRMIDMVQRLNGDAPVLKELEEKLAK